MDDKKIIGNHENLVEQKGLSSKKKLIVGSVAIVLIIGLITGIIISKINKKQTTTVDEETKSQDISQDESEDYFEKVLGEIETTSGEDDANENEDVSIEDENGGGAEPPESEIIDLTVSMNNEDFKDFDYDFIEQVVKNYFSMAFPKAGTVTLTKGEEKGGFKAEVASGQHFTIQIKQEGELTTLLIKDEDGTEIFETDSKYYSL